MPQEIRIWNVTSDTTPLEMSRSEIDLEKRLESLLKKDISILDPDLLIIGQQQPTPYGGIIDLLCLDQNGDLVIIELKKGKTSREVTAQVLDYASSVKDFGVDEIRQRWSSNANLHVSLDQAFEAKFDKPLPDTLNDSQKSLIVAQVIDGDTERIVRYLSDQGIQINVATVQFFMDEDGREILAQVFLIEPEVAQERIKARSKRTRSLLAKEMQALATDRGVGPVYEKLCNDLSGIMSHGSHSDKARYFRVNTEEGWRMIFVAEVGSSDENKGLEVRMNATRLANHFEIDHDKVADFLPANKEPMPPSDWRRATEEEKNNWYGYRCYFRNKEEVERFVRGLNKSELESLDDNGTDLTQPQ